MNDDPEQLDRHVEDLLQDRKPERTPLSDEDALRARQTADVARGQARRGLAVERVPGADAGIDPWLGR